MPKKYKNAPEIQRIVVWFPTRLTLKMKTIDKITDNFITEWQTLSYCNNNELVT